jgi:hypothetical protein
LTPICRAAATSFVGFRRNFIQAGNNDQFAKASLPKSQGCHLVLSVFRPRKHPPSPVAPADELCRCLRPRDLLTLPRSSSIASTIRSSHHSISLSIRSTETRTKEADRSLRSPSKLVALVSVSIVGRKVAWGRHLCLVFLHRERPWRHQLALKAYECWK